MYSTSMLTGWMEAQKPQAPAMKDAPAFYRNLEQALDMRRAGHAFLTAKPRWDDSVADFTSSDFLSLNRSGRLREAVLAELARHTEPDISAAGSRTQYGNYNYINQVEAEIAAFLGAETAFIVHSGFLANLGILSAVPLPGDAIVYDELVHVSMHEGMSLSQAAHRVVFRHNDVDSLREVLAALKDAHPAIQSGARSVLICVESIYSMDGDVCPLKEFVEVAKQTFPLGNAQFLMDEAHSTGVIGPKGAGLVSMLGLEKEIAIRLHMSSKALASTGGVILCNKTVRAMLLNHARFIGYSGAPSVPMVASIRVGYQLMASGATETAQHGIQRLVKHFFKTITSNAIWDEATDEGVLSIPLAEDWELRPYMTHVVPVHTRQRHEMFLFFHLMLVTNMNAYPISYPTVPKGKSRVRLVFHAHNTIEQVEALAAAICDWAQEMLEIEQGSTLPSAARQVYAFQSFV